jgi:putative membrane protein
MMTDFVLASVHHVLVLGLVAVFAAEAALIRPGLGGAALARLGRLDRVYGLLAMAVIVIGVSRVFFGLKGWEFYVYNHSFWGKMLAFIAIGLLSIGPTVAIVRWSRTPGATVADAEIARARRYIQAQAVLFGVVVIFAAAMARAIGA